MLSLCGSWGLLQTHMDVKEGPVGPGQSKHVMSHPPLSARSSNPSCRCPSLRYCTNRGMLSEALSRVPTGLTECPGESIRSRTLGSKQSQLGTALSFRCQHPSMLAWLLVWLAVRTRQSMRCSQQAWRGRMSVRRPTPARAANTPPRGRLAASDWLAAGLVVEA